MLIKTSDCPPQPWKNGGGVTRELLAWPLETKGTDNWQLRISVADITLDGAFSSFAGVRRAFAVMEGAGVELQFANGQQTPARQTITKDSDSFVFEGADAPYCKLIEGSTRDLNVMCKHGHTARLTRAYAGQTGNCRGYFSLSNQSLTWMTANAIFPSCAGIDPQKHIGWWIDFL